MTNATSPAAQESEMKHEQQEAKALHQTELIISFVLRFGVLLSGSVILFGFILFLFHRESGSLHNLEGTHPIFPHTFSAVLAGVGNGDPVAMIMLGLVLLIATPVTRVAISILAFAVEKDWTYVIITCVVLTILLISFFLGKAGG